MLKMLAAAIRRVFCRHAFWVSDYSWLIDERGIRFVLDRCALCGKRDRRDESC